MKLKAILGLLVVVAFFGCKKKDDITPPEWKRSYLHILGAAQNSDTFNVTFDYYDVDDVVIKDYYFQRNWPISGYGSLIEGGVPDEFGNGKIWLTAVKKIYIAGTKPDTTVGPQDILLTPEEKSTVIFADSGGKTFMMKIKDVYANGAGVANVRFINLRQANNSVTFHSTDATINIPSVRFPSDSPFGQFTAGTYTFEALDDSTGLPVSSLNGIELLENTTYTFYLSGSSPILHYYRN